MPDNSVKNKVGNMKKLLLIGLGLLALAAENIIVTQIAISSTRDRVNAYRDIEARELRDRIQTLVTTPIQRRDPFASPFDESPQERMIRAQEESAAALLDLAHRERMRDILGR